MKYETKRNLLLILTMVFSVIYLIWRLFFTLPISAGGIQLVCGILLFWAEAVTILELLSCTGVKCATRPRKSRP